MKQLLTSKYLNHWNSQHKVERNKIDSGIELQSRESEKEDSGLLNYRMNINFVMYSEHQTVFLRERLYSLSYHYFFYSFRYLILVCTMM